MWRRGSITRPPVTLHTIPETGQHSEPHAAGNEMSSRGSGGNSEAMGRRGRGMGHVLYGNVQQVDGYNGAENSQASPQEDPVEQG